MGSKGIRDIGDTLIWKGSAPELTEGGQELKGKNVIRYRGVFVPADFGKPVAIVAFEFEVPQGAKQDRVADEMVEFWRKEFTEIVPDHKNDDGVMDLVWATNPATPFVALHLLSSNSEPIGPAPHNAPGTTNPHTHKVFSGLEIYSTNK